MEVKNKGNLLQSYFQKLDYMIIQQICEKLGEIGSAQPSDINKLMGLQNVSGGMKTIEYELLGIMSGAKDEIYNIVEETAREYYGEAVKSQEKPKAVESHREILQIADEERRSKFSNGAKIPVSSNDVQNGRDTGDRKRRDWLRDKLSQRAQADAHIRR